MFNDQKLRLMCVVCVMRWAGPISPGGKLCRVRAHKSWGCCSCSCEAMPPDLPNEWPEMNVVEQS